MKEKLINIIIWLAYLTLFSSVSFADPQDFKITKTFDNLGYLPIKAIAFSPDSKYLFTICQATDSNKQSAIRIFDLTSDNIITKSSPFDELAIEKMIYSPDGTKIGILTLFGLFVFEIDYVSNSNLSLSFFMPRFQTSEIYDFAFTQNSKSILWASGSVEFSELDTGRRETIETDHRTVRGIGYNPKIGSIVALHNNFISIIKGGKVSSSYEMPDSHWIQSAVPVSPNGKYAIIDDSLNLIVDTDEAQVIKKLSLTGMNSSYNRVKFSADSSHIILEGKTEDYKSNLLKTYTIIEDQWRSIPAFDHSKIEDFSLNTNGSKAAVSTLSFKDGQSQIFILE